VTDLRRDRTGRARRRGGSGPISLPTRLNNAAYATIIATGHAAEPRRRVINTPRRSRLPTHPDSNRPKHPQLTSSIRRPCRGRNHTSGVVSCCRGGGSEFFTLNVANTGPSPRGGHGDRHGPTPVWRRSRRLDDTGTARWVGFAARATRHHPGERTATIVTRDRERDPRHQHLHEHRAPSHGRVRHTCQFEHRDVFLTHRLTTNQRILPFKTHKEARRARATP